MRLTGHRPSYGPDRIIAVDRRANTGLAWNRPSATQSSTHHKQVGAANSRIAPGTLLPESCQVESPSSVRTKRQMTPAP